MEQTSKAWKSLTAGGLLLVVIGLAVALRDAGAGPMHGSPLFAVGCSVCVAGGACTLIGMAGGWWNHG